MEEVGIGVTMIMPILEAVVLEHRSNTGKSLRLLPSTHYITAPRAAMEEVSISATAIIPIPEVVVLEVAVPVAQVEANRGTRGPQEVEVAVDRLLGAQTPCHQFRPSHPPSITTQSQGNHSKKSALKMKLRLCIDM